MKDTFLFLVVIGIMMTGCKKDDCQFVCQNGGTLKKENCSCTCPTGYSGSLCEIDNRPSCERNKTGDIVFNSFSSNPYTCFVDGINKGTCYGYSTLRVTISEGSHSARVLQQSGYLIYPTDQTKSLTVARCYEYTFIFP